ncbi:MAG TPA: PASTA domain-containing protein, partial [Solirubrobacterales bacterium]|nr:PASTA domain-containing protein [Solirubrobacterales bacterium]
AQIEGSGIANPYLTTVEIPDCGAYLWGECAEKLEEAGLEPSRVELDWETAVLTKPADAVVETAPAGGAVVETGSKVTVTTNPDEAGMPVVIPPPEPGETYDDYAARLVPSLDPSRITVGLDFYDPTTGPDGVIRTVPKSGTRTNPATETEVDVHANPADSPPATPASWTAPPVSGIDLSPLAGVSIGCNDFPFGIFCWIGSGLTAWGPGGECPQLGVPFGSSIGADEELAFDTCLFEPAMEVVRPVLILLAAFSLAYLFAAAAMGFGGSTGDD